MPVFCVRVSCDNWNFNASNPCVYVGGNYSRNGNHGLFYVNYNSVSNSSSNIGSRILSACLANVLNSQRQRRRCPRHG